MSYTNGLDNPELYFQTKLYTGNGGTQSITFDGSENMQPDWVWLKQRANDVSNRNHMLFDSVRGTQKALSSNTTGAEDSSTSYLTSYDSDGFTVGASSVLNRNTTTYSSWNWLGANGTASNSDGSITSSVSASTTAGFSIVSFTGTGANATIGHGLGVAPNVVITKNRDNARNWIYGGDNIAWTKYMILNLTNASASANNAWNDTAPTSSVVSLGSSTVTNESSAEMIAYCFAEKTGYSKFGSYTGNGNADGTFVYTGFKPAWIICKRSSGTGNWQMFDSKREGYNVDNDGLQANLSNAEATDDDLDILSNGFKFRGTGNDLNGSGSTYIYMAFAENPFVNSNGVPTNAR